MQITRNVLPLSDLYNWLEDHNLIINKDYQRGEGLWPIPARVYFIDTILNGFPFPKITLRQTMNLKSKKAIREVIDGQQRLTAIRDFVNNKLKLTSASKKYSGKTFSDLDEEIREIFLAYEISVDIVTIGTNEEALEIFRRMNSYTLPLNDAEKRHATYHGKFKWYILDLLVSYTPVLEKLDVLSIKDIGRMKDADLFTEITQIIIYGMDNRAKNKLEQLYSENDKDFPQELECRNKIIDAMDYIKDNMSTIFIEEKIPSYIFYTLFAALIYNMHGFRNADIEYIGYKSINKYSNDIEYANQRILEMMRDVGEKNEKGMYAEFVRACISTTHSKKSRYMRLSYFVAILQGKK